MNIDLGNIKEHTIPLDGFQLKWRFTEEKYDILPEYHLNQLLPLNEEASNYLWNLIEELGIHDDEPFWSTPNV